MSRKLQINCTINYFFNSYLIFYVYTTRLDKSSYSFDCRLALVLSPAKQRRAVQHGSGLAEEAMHFLSFFFLAVYANGTSTVTYVYGCSRARLLSIILSPVVAWDSHSRSACCSAVIWINVVNWSCNAATSCVKIRTWPASEQLCVGLRCI